MTLVFKGHRHAQFYLAVLASALVFPAVCFLRPDLSLAATANAFFFVYLLLTALKLPYLTPSFLKHNAAGEDEPAWIIFAVTLTAVLVSIGSLFVLINEHGPLDMLELGLSLASVGLGWLTIHTMAALHYAHRYWRPDETAEGGRRAEKPEPQGGLEYPGGKLPGGYDFLYFSFVIGMTAQTSDVQITTTAMRKLNLLHAVVSFFFNTVLVAAAVNIAVSLPG